MHCHLKPLLSLAMKPVLHPCDKFQQNQTMRGSVINDLAIFPARFFSQGVSLSPNMSPSFSETSRLNATKFGQVIEQSSPPPSPSLFEILDTLFHFFKRRQLERNWAQKSRPNLGHV